MINVVSVRADKPQQAQGTPVLGTCHDTRRTGKCSCFPAEDMNEGACDYYMQEQI